MVHSRGLAGSYVQLASAQLTQVPSSIDGVVGLGQDALGIAVQERACGREGYRL